MPRGYLEHEINPDDRRPISTGLTHRGCAATAAIRTGVADIDAELVQRCQAGDAL